MSTTSDIDAPSASATSSGAMSGGAVRRLARVAIGGQVAFAMLWLFAGLVEPDYDPARQTISELAAQDAHHPWIVTTSFIVFGAGLAALAVALHGSVTADKRPWFGTGMLLVGAATMPLVAGARMDCSRSSQACRDLIDADLVSGQHALHDLASLVVFVMMVFAPLVFARRFRHDPRWRDLRRGSRVTTAVAFALLVGFIGFADGTAVGGIVQRTLLAVVAAWIIVVARRAERIATVAA